MVYVCCSVILLLLFGFVKSYKEYVEGFSEPQMEHYVKSLDYPIESHNVETTEGYIIKVFRIPHGKYNKSKSKGPPIILMHAFLTSSESFIMLGENQSLSFMAAEAGYDVWMPNARGNTHSRKHKTLDPDKDFSFWDFSWHELGAIDLPCVIDYIIEKTKFSKVSYIGHSQGGTILFVMISERPEYKKKINVAIGLAPAVILNSFDYPYLIESVDNFDYFYDQLYKFLGTLPGGSSIKTMAHFAQVINSQSFVKFDYGPEKNLKIYNSSTPPPYNLTNMDIPFYIFVGKNDVMVSIEDLKLLNKSLPNVKGFEVIPIKKFNHLDFILAKNLDTILNNKILKILNNYKLK